MSGSGSRVLNQILQFVNISPFLNFILVYLSTKKEKNEPSFSWVLPPRRRPSIRHVPRDFRKSKVECAQHVLVPYTQICLKDTLYIPPTGEDRHRCILYIDRRIFRIYYIPLTILLRVLYIYPFRTCIEHRRSVFITRKTLTLKCF